MRRKLPKFVAEHSIIIKGFRRCRSAKSAASQVEVPRRDVDCRFGFAKALRRFLIFVLNPRQGKRLILDLEDGPDYRADVICFVTAGNDGAELLRVGFRQQGKAGHIPIVFIPSLKTKGIGGDRDGYLAGGLLTQENSLPCALETLQLNSGRLVGCISGGRAREDTGHEQKKGRQSRQSFEDQFHFLSLTPG